MINMSTFSGQGHIVCVAPLIGISGQRWEESNVRNKLSRVLWIPVEGIFAPDSAEDPGEMTTSPMPTSPPERPTSPPLPERI